MTDDIKIRLIGFSVLAVITIWITIAITWAFYCSLASRHWPQTWGRITLSGVRTRESLGGSFWVPEVEYQYHVSGILYRSSKLRFVAHNFTDRSAAASVPESYPVGRVVKIAYDPKLPTRSVLEPGVPESMWREAIAPCLLWLVLAYVYYNIAHSRRRLLFGANKFPHRNEAA